MIVGANTRLFGSIFDKDSGEKPLSILLHNGMFDRHKETSCVVPMAISPAFLESSVYSLRSGYINAIELSNDMSEKVIPYLDVLNAEAHAMNFADFVYWKDNMLVGDNTMMRGFENAVIPKIASHLMASPKNLVMIYGTGHAAQCAIDRLAAFTANFTIVSRVPNDSNPNMAKIERILLAYPNVNIEVVGYDDAMPDPNDIIVNATKLKCSPLDIALSSSAFKPRPEQIMIDWSVSLKGDSDFTKLAVENNAVSVRGNSIYANICSLRYGSFIGDDEYDRASHSMEMLNMLDGMVKHA